VRATVYYDANGFIQSVVYVQPKSRTKPLSAEHASVEIDLKDTKPNTLADLHSKYRVDTHKRKLIRRSGPAENA
jgi:hypothetical protein